MCGIVGICLQDRNALRLGQALYSGLLRLEYRGYDSAGLAVVDENKLKVLKGKGKLIELEGRLGFTNLGGTVGIGHTRWATHGPPSDVNAHPHTDCKGLFAIVHNGIIENYYELKKDLLEKGHAFKSQTDTEVVVHLIEDFYEQVRDVYESFRRAIKTLKGAYAILMITPLDLSKIFFAKKDSPLVLGIGDSYNLVASDIPALLEHTRRVIAVRDYWMGYISPREVYIEDILTGDKVNYENYVKVVDWKLEDASKEGYTHFMLKEINEQPRALTYTISGLRSDSSVKEVVDLLTKANKIYIVGAGTSYHASEFLALSSMKLAGEVFIPFIASEYDVYANSVSESDVLIAVTQSGETIDVLKAVRGFKNAGGKIVAVTNIVDSAVPRESDVAVYMRAGPEIGVAATKTFLAQVLTLSFIVLEYAHKRGVIDSSEYRSILDDLEKSSSLVARTINETSSFVERLSEKLINTRSMYYLSRGVGVPTAREGALKIKEIAYVHAEAYPAGESKHGPIALVEPGFPVVFVVPNDHEIERKIHSNVEEMKARGALTIGVLYKDSYLKELVDVAIEVPRGHWITTPITHVPPLQLLAYHLAVKRGHDPDRPRNLAKTVTVE
ncbi:MAG: glutamine--fructose-6-phosphate transaminase (isomerizing) [Desulfurococcaceae archaeon]